MPSKIKQLVVLRRRTGQTMQEFFDHHYQVHGALSDQGKPEESPSTYYQTHFFDSAYNRDQLAQPTHTGHNDSTELYFEDEENLKRCFGSQHVREVIGPDGINFNDSAAAIPMFVTEKLIHGDGSLDQGVEQALVATYYVQASDADADVQTVFPEKLHPEVMQAFGNVSTKIVANVALPDPGNMLKYFRGDVAPVYSAAYQIYLRDQGQIKAFREAQKKLEEGVGGVVKAETAFVTFGVRSVVLDHVHGVKFDKSNQPRLP